MMAMYLTACWPLPEPSLCRPKPLALESTSEEPGNFQRDEQCWSTGPTAASKVGFGQETSPLLSIVPSSGAELWAIQVNTLPRLSHAAFALLRLSHAALALLRLSHAALVLLRLSHAALALLRLSPALGWRWCISSEWQETALMPPGSE
jgi:hypothetical protein